MRLKELKIKETLKGGEKMIKQSISVDLIAALHQASTTVKNFDSSSISSQTNFKDFLDKSIDKTYVDNTAYENSLRNSADNNSMNKNSEESFRLKSYRQVKQENENLHKASDVEDTNETDNAKDPKKVKSAETTSKEKAMLDNLAQILGISSDQLKNVLAAANINPEDFTDAAKLGVITDKLANLLGLDGSQKAALTQLINTIGNLGKTDNGWVQLNNPNITVINETSTHGNDILSKIKSKMQELSQQLELKPESSEGEISASITQTKDMNTKGGASLVKTVNDEKNGDSKPLGLVDSKEVQLQNASNNQVENTVISVVSTINTDNIVTANSLKGSTDTSSFISLGVDQVQKSDSSSTVAASRVNKEVTVTKSEIINQVIEKAKVVLTGDKSEMIIDLKPDTLGKLALKIVTERGIVVAKFMAESQKVKEALEANMQSLKDSLEKQGLSVQGVSVSVNQDSQKGFRNNRETWESFSQTSGKPQNNESGTVNVASISESQQKLNPYSWNNNQINLTA